MMHCTKCGTKLFSNGEWEKRGSNHHVYPVRWFGKGKHNRMKVLFCGNCHQELENILRNFEEKIIALMIRQQGLSKRPSKSKQKRLFVSMKQIYLQIVNDYVKS